jgi:ADP-heptose:LPS heptosyltransferase
MRCSYAPPFAREGAHLFATHRASLFPPRASRFDRNLALLRFLGSSAAPDATPFRVDPEALRRVTADVARERPYVVLHPGTSANTPYKRWMPSGFGRVAAVLRKQCGLASLVTYGADPDERRLAAAVVAESDGAAMLAPATGTLHELAAVLLRGRLFVGADTGPLHIASLVGTPVVQILGPTDPVENAPWRETPSRTVRVSQPCSPCRRGCEAATCMRAVTPEQVVSAARELLGA